MADRLTTEEKIRRLQEQIEKLKAGDDKPANLVYANQHFYVRRHARGRSVKERTQYVYELYSRHAHTERVRKVYSGFWIRCDDFEEWFADAEKVMEFLRSVDQEQGRTEG